VIWVVFRRTFLRWRFDLEEYSGGRLFLFGLAASLASVFVFVFARDTPFSSIAMKVIHIIHVLPTLLSTTNIRLYDVKTHSYALSDKHSSNSIQSQTISLPDLHLTHDEPSNRSR